MLYFTKSLMLQSRFSNFLTHQSIFSLTFHTHSRQANFLLLLICQVPQTKPGGISSFKFNQPIQPFYWFDFLYSPQTGNFSNIQLTLG